MNKIQFQKFIIVIKIKILPEKIFQKKRLFSKNMGSPSTGST